MRTKIEVEKTVFIGMTATQAEQMSELVGSIGDNELTQIFGKVRGQDKDLQSIKETIREFHRAINDIGKE